MKISANQYAKSLYNLTENKTHQEIDGLVLNFIKFLQKNRQLKLAGKIIEKFGEIYNKKNGIVEVAVTTRCKIQDTITKQCESFIKEKYSAKKVVLKNIVDENIKGGVIIKIGDEVVDGSVGGKLSRLKNCLNH